MNFELKKAILKKYGTQRKFSKVIGISESQISQIVKGRINPTPVEKQLISKLLNSTQKKIFTEE